MKKFLLIAAMAALAIGANADGYKFEKVWSNTDVASLWLTGVRQGFGLNGKYYINDTQFNGDGTPTIYIYGENGLDGTLPGSANEAFTRDEAGNLIYMNNVPFASHTNDIPWPLEAGASIVVVNPTTLVSKEYVIPEDALPSGRLDCLGFAKGNLLEDGQLFLVGGKDETHFLVMTIAGGEVEMDECYKVNNDKVSATTSTVINYYTDVAGNEALLYVTRNAQIVKIPMTDLTDGEVVVLPGRAPSNGAFPFVWDGKELFVYPYKTPADANYLDGWAIAEAGADEPIAVAPTLFTARTNEYQSNWVNAEVDANGVTIYHYYPGGYLDVWRLTKDEPVPEPKKVYMLGGDDQPWDPTNGTEFVYDAEKNVYTATVTFPAEYNFFGFTTELAENNDDGGWAYIEPFRFGAIADEGTDYWYSGEEDFISLTWDEYHAIRIPAGEYNMTVNLEDMKLFIEEVAPAFLRGDVDMSGDVKIGDVTALINYLLSGDATGISLQAADCDQNGEIKIGDVTALINFLLSGTWAE